MGALTIRKGDRETRSEIATIPTMLEFHSPTAALAHAPIQGSARQISLAVCTLVAACFAAAGLIPIDKVVAVPGKVISVDATTVVQPLEAGIVRSIGVREGQIVKKGQVLARLDPTFATADASALQSQTDSLQAEVDRLTAEAAGKVFKPESTSPISLLQAAIHQQRMAERGFKTEGYNQKINSLQSQIQRAMSDVAAYRERLKVAQTVEQKRLELERAQVGSALNSLAATDSRLEVERGLASATAMAAQGARDLAAMQADRDAYEQNWRAQVIQDLTDQSRKLSDAKENLAKAARRRDLIEMRAPEDAIVLNIAKVSVGSVLQSGEQLMSLTPLDAALEVEANVPGTESGFVHAGNPVTLKLESFPSAQYGDITGDVRFVSPDSFTGDPDQRQRGVQQMPQTGTAFYRIRISIGENNMHDTPNGFRLVPGMPITADIKVGKRTVLSYLFGRVLPVAMDGMREP